LNSDADLEPLEEPLAENGIVATQAESDPGEETLDESLIEEPDGERFEQESAYAIREQGKTLAATNRDFPAPPGDTAANRDVASMLKDIVLPSADIREGMEQFVLFSLGEQLFAAPVANVAELSLPPDFIMLPNTPQWLLGIANMRGEIISIADLRGFLSMDQESIKKTARMIIAQTLDRRMMVGLIVGRINGIHYFATDDIVPFEQQAPGSASAYISGTCAFEDTVVAILDLEKLLQSPKMGQFQ
jgi:chemotaxis signal transduction protein